METLAVQSDNIPGTFLPRKRSRQKSKIANGALLSGVDGRSPWVRRAKEVIGDLVADRGGADLCSAAEHSLIRRSAVLTSELERLETKFALAGQADTADLDLYLRACVVLRRLLVTVGIDRRSRDISNFNLGDAMLFDARQRAAEAAVERVADDEALPDTPDDETLTGDAGNDVDGHST